MQDLKGLFKETEEERFDRESHDQIMNILGVIGIVILTIVLFYAKD